MYESFSSSFSNNSNETIDLLPTNGFEPSYNPDYWNKQQHRLDNYNCYDYSINNTREQKRKSQPNNIQIPDKPYNCYDLENSLKKDIPGIRITGDYEKCPANFSKIMLITTTDGKDYHFLRQDSNKLWSHKAGDGPVNRKDSNGNLIKNPRFSNIQNEIGDYKNQCAMYCIPTDTQLPQHDEKFISHLNIYD